MAQTGRQITPDPEHHDTIYAPGLVRIGAIWNRFGESTGNQGEDWPRTLAHELGHFAFFLDDNYLGLDTNGRLVPIDSCTGAMTDPYRNDFYNEFHPDADWLPSCVQTLSNRSTGRSDWATIKMFYPWLNKPSGTINDENPGPNTIPLDLTHITFVDPVTPCETLDVPILYLSQDNARVEPGSGAQAILFRREGDRLVDLGRPRLDQVTARGARPGDRLCVYEIVSQSDSRLGCKEIQANSDQLVLENKSGCLPDIVVTPVTSRTINLAIGHVPTGLSLKARLYPSDSPASDEIQLTNAGEQYTG